MGLLAVAALLLAGVGTVGSGLVGQLRNAAPTLEPPGIVKSDAPLATTAARASPVASPTPGLTPSIQALRAGGRVVFEHWDLPALGLTRLEYLAPDLTGRELLPDVPGVQEAPAWSADGSRLAFVGYDPAAAEQPAIWETDANGAIPRLVSVDCLPPGCVGEHDPAYSADGRYLAFMRTAGEDRSPPGTWVLAVRDLMTGNVQELDSTRVDYAVAALRHPSWSPDGSEIAFGTTLWDADGVESGSTVSIVNVDGSSLRQLVPAELEAGDPTWSSDRSTIVFSSRPIHDFQVSDVPKIHLYAVSPDGADLRQLDTSGGAGTPSWAGDGSQILFTRLIGFTRGGLPDLGPERPNLMVMNPDGSDVRPVTTFQKCCRWYWVQQPGVD